MASLPLPLTDPGRRVLTVSELTHAVKDTLEGRFGGLWVEGEISNLRVHTSGHVYFTLKDEEAQVRAVLFRSRGRRLRFEPADGLHIPACAPPPRARRRAPHPRLRPPRRLRRAGRVPVRVRGAGAEGARRAPARLRAAQGP